ncbi:MAG: glycosyltransferase family 4 protein [Candidatus Tyrphobacter sp.]
MRLAVISSGFPCGRREPYLATELAALRPLVAYLAVAPLRPNGRPLEAYENAVLPSTGEIVRDALAATLRAPKACAGALADVALSPKTVRAKLKNLYIFARALALAQRFHRDGVEHVHAYWLSTPATAAYVIGRVNAIPWSSTAHRWDIFENNMIARKVESAQFVRVISERGRAALAAYAPGHEKKTTVVRLGTALQDPPAVQASRSSVRLLCAAAFVATKGHADLLQAFAQAHAQHPQLELTLAGAGPLQASLLRRARTMRCAASIEFRGYVRREGLLRELAAGHYDAVVLSSRDDGVREMEGVPSILIEASSLGVASIATRSGAVEELLDEESAFLAQPQNVQSLAHAISEATDAAARAARARRALERTRNLHDPAQTAARIAGLIAGATGEAA